MTVTLSKIKDLTNAQVSDVVINKMPQNTYTSVITSKENHYFQGVGDLSGRKITLHRSTVDCFFESFKRFFLELFLPEEARKKYEKEIDKKEILSFVAGNGNKIEDIKNAYIQCKTIRIFISEDGNHSDIELLDSKLMLIAKSCGSIGQKIIDIATTHGTIKNNN